ncbi:MAG: hypothetical protein IJL30_04785 [Clostridia bacterium]|nr:hypothetical protein [Clostridia bacterium]
MKCVFQNCRGETDKYVTLNREDENGNVLKETVPVCDGCVNVYLNAQWEKYRSLRKVCTGILGYGLAALILPALIFEIMRVPAYILCPLIAAVFIPLTVFFRRKEIECGNDLVDANLEKYRVKAALEALGKENGTKYSVAE